MSTVIKKGKKDKHLSKAVLTDTDMESLPELSLSQQEEAEAARSAKHDAAKKVSAEKAAKRKAVLARAQALVAKHAKETEDAAAAAASAPPTTPVEVPPTAEQAAQIKALKAAAAINRAKRRCRLGWASMPLYIDPYAEAKRPELRTRGENNRGAPDETVWKFINKCNDQVGGVDRDNFKFALVLLVKAGDITNLEEIREWAPGSDEALLNIVWADGTTKAKFMELLNGFHRLRAIWLLLEAKFKKLADIAEWNRGFKNTTSPSEKQIHMHERSKKDMSDTYASIEENSVFAVELYDMGKFLFSPEWMIPG